MKGMSSSSSDDYRKLAKLYTDKDYTKSQVEVEAKKMGIPKDGENFSEKMKDALYNYSVYKNKDVINEIKKQWKDKKINETQLKEKIQKLDIPISYQKKLYKEI